MRRLRATHLLLDTLNYNSHTSASDALWQGVPLLTFPGKRMHSRVAASIAFAVGPELGESMIVSSVSEYIERAVFLATHPEHYNCLKRRLCDSLDTCPLFDSHRWVCDFERGLKCMWEQCQEGDGFSDIVLSP